MQEQLSGVVPLVTTPPESCSGSHKEQGWRRLWIAMDEKVQQRDLWASTCAQLCACARACTCARARVRTIVMWIITPFAQQWPWVSEKMLQILIFADKAQCQEGRNEFYFKDVSHSTDYIPLHLRCLAFASLISPRWQYGDCRPILQPEL